MIGAIAGDIIGSVYEGGAAPPRDFELLVPASRFTDDTVLTVAVASAIRNGLAYAQSLQHWGRQYPYAGYGGLFFQWLGADEPKPYNSYGNGSAMRVSSVGWAYDDLETVLEQALQSAAVTHNHPEGIRGAQSVAGAIFLGRTGASKAQIRRLLTDRFGYDCSARLAELHQDSDFDTSCQGTVPVAAVAFLESEDFEDAIRNAVSLGGDADTLACIAGAMAESYFGGTPDWIQRQVLRRLDESLLTETVAFARQYGIPLSFES